MVTPLHPRYVTGRVLDALADTPVVAINGARQVGKSTLVEQLVAERPDATIVTLDDQIQLESARADPRTFVEREGLLVIDEIQRAPELLPAIKASVDRHRTAGRYLITGSTRLLSTSEMGESLAGRVDIVDLWPLSQGELAGSQERFVDALFTWDPALLTDSDISSQEYNRRLCAGGFPEPLTRGGRRRSAWFRNYATTVLERMVRDVAHIQRLSVMPRLLRLCAARTANELNVTDLAGDAGLPPRTVHDYLAHLQQVFLLQLLPAWSRNLTSKVVHKPKMLVTDSGLAADLIGVDTNALGSHPSPIGQLMETFVAMEIRKQLAWSDTEADLFHFRDRGGAEIDLVLESRDGRVAGIEVKASSTVRNEDFRGLQLLRDRLGAKFVGGVVLHRGPEAVSFGDRLRAVPSSALWLTR